MRPQLFLFLLAMLAIPASAQTSAAENAGPARIDQLEETGPEFQAVQSPASWATITEITDSLTRTAARPRGLLSVNQSGPSPRNPGRSGFLQRHRKLTRGLEITGLIILGIALSPLALVLVLLGYGDC